MSDGPGPGVPHPQPAIETTGCQQGTIRGEGQREYGVRPSLYDHFLLFADHVPDDDGTFEAPRGQPSAIRGVGHLLDFAWMCPGEMIRSPGRFFVPLVCQID